VRAFGVKAEPLVVDKERGTASWWATQ